MRGLAAERATGAYLAFLRAPSQVAACPLTQFYGEWGRVCTLTEWMYRILRLGYLLQSCSIPSPFRCVREVNLSTEEEMDFLSAEIQDLLQKQLLSCHMTESGFYFAYFLVPKKMGG